MVCRSLFGDDNRLNTLTADCTLPYFVTQSEVGAYDTVGLANSAVVSGTLAYVADGAGGLQIIDISDPANPTLIGSLGAISSARGIDLALYPLATVRAHGQRQALRRRRPLDPRGRPIVTTPTPSSARQKRRQAAARPGCRPAA